MVRIYMNNPCSKLPGSVTCGQCIWVVAAFIIILILGAGTMLLQRSYTDEIIEHAKSGGSSLQYGIVIDCGSSGSRIYVYYWPPHSGNLHDLLAIQQLTDENGQPIAKKVSPGLSEFEDNPDAASDHIKPLLTYASQYIPREQHKETPLYILATAGMRMLPEIAQRAILADLHADIRKDFDFLVAENHFEVISGKQEGVYAWIAVNYVLDKFSHGEEDHSMVSLRVTGAGTEERVHRRRRTVGMLDMGGGSVQIAFEIIGNKAELPKALTAEFNLGCRESDVEHTYRVYVTTFLGFGANSAREHYEELLVKAQQQNTHQMNASQPTPDPCLPTGMPLESENDRGIKTSFLGTGNYSACKRALRPLLNLTVPCEREPCSMNGVYQPHVDFDRADFYGFSEFWYSMEDVFRLGGPYSYLKFDQHAKEFCSTRWAKLKEWYDNKLFPKADDKRMSYQCFKAAWLTTVFHDGFRFPEEYTRLQSASLISGKDVQWTLGALIYRTRFLPLREIQLREQQNSKLQSGGMFSYHARAEHVIIFCFIIVITAIILYMKRLRLCPKRTDITSVPSLSYLLPQTDEMEKGTYDTRYKAYT